MVEGWKTHSNERKIGLENTLFFYDRELKSTLKGEEKIGLENALYELMVEDWKTLSKMRGKYG